jgi:hypothetical protein
MRRQLTLSALLLVAACATIEPFDPPVAGELNPEPGLFSGPGGEFVLRRGGAWDDVPDDASANADKARSLTLPPAP